MFYFFFGLFTPTTPTVNGGEAGLFFIFLFSLLKYSSVTVGAAIVVNKRDDIIAEVDQAFALTDFVASESFNFDPFVVSWKK